MSVFVDRSEQENMLSQLTVAATEGLWPFRPSVIEVEVQRNYERNEIKVWVDAYFGSPKSKTRHPFLVTVPPEVLDDPVYYCSAFADMLDDLVWVARFRPTIEDHDHILGEN